jgi:3-hydroxyacyl-[acyl-carrier-protein] dehydratase
MNASESAPLTLLPHGPEFRFLDRVVSLDPGRTATAEYTVRGDEFFLAGHFPGDPIFPGVLMVEGGAQLAGIVAQTAVAPGCGERLQLTALRAVKILGGARPGDTIEFRTRLIARLGKLVQAEVTAFIGCRMIMQGEVTLTEPAAEVGAA